MTATAWATVVIGGILTFGIRALPLGFASRAGDLNPRVVRVLALIPPAVFAALVAPALMAPDGDLDLLSSTLAAGLVGGVVGKLTGKVIWTLVAGFSTAVLLDLL